MQKVVDWVANSLLSSVEWLFYNIFDTCYAFIKYLFNAIKSVITGEKISGIGNDFFGFMADSFNGTELTFNIVYVVVGFSIFMFMCKRFVIPLIIALINSIIDAVTPLS